MEKGNIAPDSVPESEKKQYKYYKNDEYEGFQEIEDYRNKPIYEQPNYPLFKVDTSKDSCNEVGVFPGQMLAMKGRYNDMLYEVIGMSDYNQLVLVNSSSKKPKFFVKSTFMEELEKGNIRHLSTEEEKELREEIFGPMESVLEKYEERKEKVVEEPVQEEKLQKEEPKKEYKFIMSKEGNYPLQIQKRLEEMETKLKINPENLALILEYAVLLGKITGKEESAKKIFEQAQNIGNERKEEDKTTEAKIVYEYVKFLKSRRYFLYLVKKELEKLEKDYLEQQKGQDILNWSLSTGDIVLSSKSHVSVLLHHALKNKENIKDNTVLIDIISAYIENMFNQRDSNSAKYRLDKYLAEYPNNARLLSSYGKFELFQKNYNNAELYFQKSFDSDSHNIENLLDYGDLNLQRGHLKKAKKCFDDIIKLEPENLDAMYGMAQIHKNYGKYGIALQYVDNILSLDPENSDAFISKAVLNYKIGNVAKSEEEFNEAFKKYTYNIRARLEFAKIEAEKGNLSQAIELLLRLYNSVRRRSTQNETLVLYTMGEIEAEEKKYTGKGWKSSFRQSLDNDKANILIHNKYAGALIKSGDLSKAEELLKKALELDAENAYTLRNYGKMLISIEGRIEEGESYISKARDFGLE